jgi:signal-transduction protein with cAMP-binding, CBS, and nucleotidyltransferase domain
MSRVGDIVHDRELFFAKESDTVAEVARHMAELQVGAILILNGEQLRGVFSERDLMQRVVVEGRQPEQTRVGLVMTTEVHTIDELATVADAMEAMQTHNCRHLPVMRGSRVINFLSMRDVMNYELAKKTEEVDHMRAYISGSA